MQINADSFYYDQIKNILEAKGNVKIEDKIENYILESEYLNYDKNSEKVFTKGNTKAFIESKYDFTSKDIFLDRRSKEFSSDNLSTIKEDNLNFYKLSKFLYYYEKKLLRAEEVKVESNYHKEDKDNFYFKKCIYKFFRKFLYF